MSLQVWMPLNGNYDNYGLGTLSATMTNSGATFENGKIGKCMYQQGVTSNSLTCSELVGATNFTMSVWLKLEEDTSFNYWADIISFNINGDGSIYPCRLEHITYDDDKRNKINPVMGRNSAAIGLTNNYVGFGNQANNYEWHHYTISFDGINAKLYVDGSLLKVIGKSILFANSYFLNGEFRIGSAGTWCKINDFRIYDHCLSPKEVKEISKALVLHYPMNQIGESMATPWTPAPEDRESAAADNTVYDASGFGNHGTIAAATAPTWSNDAVVGSGSYSFSGAQYISIPAIYEGKDIYDFTISGWAMAKTGWSSDSGIHIISMGDNYGIRVALGKGNMIWAYCGNNGGSLVTYGSASNITVDTWYHVAITFSNGIIKAYLNGNLVVTNDISSRYKYITFSQNRDNLIGSYLTSTEFAVGNINDVRVYSTALSDSDIKDLYQNRFSLADNGTLFCSEYVEPDGVMGGRNLAYSSATMGNLGNAGASACSKTTEASAEAASGTIVKYTCTTAGSGGGPFASVLFARERCIEGKVYTWSIWVKSSVAKTFPTIGHECGGTKGVTVTTSWQKITHTYTANNNKYAAFVFYGPWNAGDILYVRDCKIEEGSMATPWCPALEDSNAVIGETGSYAPQFLATGVAKGGLVETEEKQMQISNYHIALENLIEY